MWFGLQHVLCQRKIMDLCGPALSVHTSKGRFPDRKGQNSPSSRSRVLAVPAGAASPSFVDWSRICLLPLQCESIQAEILWNVDAQTFTASS